MVGVTVQGAFLIPRVAFGQGATYKGVFGIGDGTLDVLLLAFNGHLVTLADVFVNQTVAAHVLEIIGDFVAHLENAAIGVSLLNIFLQLVVVL